MNLKENATNDRSFLSKVITDDETWVYTYDPETKDQPSQWKSLGSPRLKKAGQVRSNIKSMLICFFDQKGIVHKESVPTGQTVNAAFYVEVLKRLRDDAPSDFFLFPNLKMKLKGRRIQTLEEIQAESQAVLNTLQENDFQECFKKWQRCWDYSEGDAGP